MRKKKEVEWVGVFLKGDLMHGIPHNYHNALESFDLAKEWTIETGEFHEVKIYVPND
jgi:hypothetical protein